MYAVSITEAATGLPIHFDLAEGFAKLPIEVDDEYIVDNGLLERPTDKPSRLAGFNNCVKLFPVMGQCMARHRRFLGRTTTGEQFDIPTEIFRINAAKQQVDDIVRALPPHLAGDWDGRNHSEEDNAVNGMQRANILITALSVKFTLVSCTTLIILCTIVAEGLQYVYSTIMKLRFLIEDVWSSWSEIPVAGRYTTFWQGQSASLTSFMIAC